MFQNLLFTKDGPIAVLQIHRPQKKNSLDAELRREMEAALRDIGNDTRIKAAIVTGGTEIFCAGADINEIKASTSAEDSFHHAREFQRLFDQVESLPQPVIAAVSGYALGGGCELTLACVYRLATFNDKIRIGLPEVNLGFVPGFGGTYRLPRMIGLSEGLKTTTVNHKILPAANGRKPYKK